MWSLVEKILGGPGSGHWGHAGRRGKRGGSLPRSAAMSIRTGKDWEVRQAIARSGKPPDPTAREVRTHLDFVYNEVKDRVWFFTQFSTTPCSVNSSREDYRANHVNMPYMEDRVERLAGFFKDHPKEARDRVRGIMLYDDATWQRAIKTRRLPRSTTGFYSIDSRIIHLPRGVNETTFNHEIGHALWQFLPGSTTRSWVSAYRGDRNFDRKTSYSRTGGVEEAFCETYAAYIKSGGKTYVEDPWQQRAFDTIGGMI